MSVLFKKTTDASSLFKKLPGVLSWLLFALGKRAFLAVLFLMLFDILLGQFLFYHYVYLAETTSPEITVISTKFKDGVFQSVVKESKRKATMFNDAINQAHQDPFK